MDLAPPPLDADPAPQPPPAAREGRAEGPPDRILGGVAALLAERLDVDALWIRIGFVLLALVGGVGLLVYAALWLALVVGADRRWARVAGGVLLLAVLPLVLLGRGDRLFTGPWAVLVLLAGLALALWQPRRPVPRAVAPRPPAPSAAEPAAAASAAAPASASASARRRSRRPRREPSALGRLTLGIAVLVSAAGAVIDQADGGRLHPEQWLGAAAIVCGVGLLVGTVVGRARWLAVPAVLFAGAGFVAGESAAMGLAPTALAGNEYLYVGPDSPTGAHLREHVVAGAVTVDVVGPPPQPVSVDAMVAFGEVRVRVADDVTVEVRTPPDSEVRVGGVAHAPGTFRVGPAGAPDAVVDAAVAHGRVEVERYARGVPEIGPLPPRATGRQPTDVADGVAMTSAGSFVLVGGEAVIGADDQVEAGPQQQQDRVTVIQTSMGEFKLLPGGLLVTPSGELLDLHALREAATPLPTTGTPTPTPAPAPAPTPAPAPAPTTGG